MIAQPAAGRLRQAAEHQHRAAGGDVDREAVGIDEIDRVRGGVQQVVLHRRGGPTQQVCRRWDRVPMGTGSTGLRV